MHRLRHTSKILSAEDLSYSVSDGKYARRRGIEANFFLIIPVSLFVLQHCETSSCEAKGLEPFPSVGTEVCMVRSNQQGRFAIDRVSRPLIGLMHGQCGLTTSRAWGLRK